MNHYSACVSYTTVCKYLKQLTQKARYLDVVREGLWQSVYDNLSYLLSIQHEREGRYTLLHTLQTQGRIFHNYHSVPGKCPWVLKYNV